MHILTRFPAFSCTKIILTDFTYHQNTNTNTNTNTIAPHIKQKMHILTPSQLSRALQSRFTSLLFHLDPKSHHRPIIVHILTNRAAVMS